MLCTCTAHWKCLGVHNQVLSCMWERQGWRCRVMYRGGQGRAIDECSDRSAMSLPLPGIAHGTQLVLYGYPCKGCQVAFNASSPQYLRRHNNTSQSGPPPEPHFCQLAGWLDSRSCRVDYKYILKGPKVHNLI